MAGEEREQDGGGLLARVLSHERELLDRNSQLSIPDKSFKQVLDLLTKVQRPPQSHSQVCTPGRCTVICMHACNKRLRVSAAQLFREVSF